ncbi:CDP-alcohol phosphatidyltransferase family protein [Oscillospiraceae bacterium MB08-C2-2]|nr:CDP-alcohol phosphatidyltransferase family protein [Oscillospiraceae bacterium MB08-C2-2]
MKHAANILSLLRIFLSLLLFFCLDRPVLFGMLYLLSGLSDLLDGYIARKTNTQSTLGARLDTLGDIFLFGVITVSVAVWMGPAIKRFIPWILVILLVRLAGMGIAAFKYRCFASLHTWANKLSGLFLFSAPVLLLLKLPKLLWAVAALCFLSAVEEALIHLTSPVLDLNRRSLFF